MTDRFKFTFNKPAVRQFLEGDDKGLRIRVEDGMVMFKTAKTADGADAVHLEQRTRGGFEATIEGQGATDILSSLQNPAGPFYVLKRRGDGWVAAHPYGGDDAPPKFEPHVRVWTAREKTAVEAKSVKKKTGKKTKAAKTAPAPLAGPGTPYLESVRAAYDKLSEAARPGRPSNEATQQRMEAREIVANFEATAKELMGVSLDGPRMDMSGLITAHKMIGDFIALTEPKSVDLLPPSTPTAAEPVAEAPAPTATKRGRKSGDTDEMSKTSLRHLGLLDADDPARQPRKARAVH